MDSPTDSNSSASVNVQSPSGSSVDQRELGSKICRVCGDRALGHNFNVVSCESCKAFFRRNALSTKEFRCPFNNSCDVSVISRKFCQKCRLRKCFEVGMKKDWIWTEEARIRKRQTTVNRRRSEKRQRYSETDNDVSSSGFVNSPANSEPRQISGDSIEGSPGIPNNLENLVASIFYPRSHSEPHESIVNPVTPQSNSTEAYLTDQVIQLLATKLSPNTLGAATTGRIPSVNNLQTSTNLFPQLGNVVPTPTAIPQVLQSLGLQMNTRPFNSASTCDPVMSTKTPVIRNPLSNQPLSFSGHQPHASSIKSSVQEGMLLTGASSIGASPSSIPTSPLLNANFIKNGIANAVNGGVTLPKELLVAILSHLVGSSDNSTTGQESLTSGRQPPISYGYPERKVCVCRCSCGKRPARDAETNTNPLDLLNFSGIADLMSSPVYSNHFGSSASSVGIGTVSNLNTSGRSLSDGNLERGVQLDESAIDVCSADDTFGIIEDSLYNMLDAAISSEFQMLGDLGPDINIDTQGPVVDSSRFQGLTSFQQEKLDELLIANEIMKEPPGRLAATDQGKRDPKCLMDVINLTDIAIRRIIQMAKQIAAFKRLCQEDQIALLKGGCIELMILRGVMSYDSEKDSWHGPMSQYIKLDILKEAKGRINLYEEHKRYLQSFKPAWRSSEPIMVILGAITLFTPSRPHVLHPDVLRKEHEMYCSLLKRYLESVVQPGCDAQNAYTELMQKVDELHQLNDNAVRVFQEVNPKNLEPLLLEIFDLKANNNSQHS